MNSLLDEDTEDDLDDRPVRARDREITLGTTMVLGIFFALAAYGAVLFGFGYSMGVKHLTATAPAADSGAGTSFNSFKPAPGLPLGTASAKPVSGPSVAVPDAPATTPAPAKPVSQTRPQNEAAPQDTATSHPATPIVRVPPMPAPGPALATVPYAGAAPGPTGAFLVQVAAVSHQEDADELVVTLKRRGYPVAIHHEPQDALLHVQVGNFVSKKDADAMRQRLLADGFNAIVK